MITLGPIARTVEDLSLLLDVIAVPSPADRAGWKIGLPAPAKTKLGHYRIDIWAYDPYCRVGADTRALLDQVADLVRGLGATVDDSTPRPVGFADSDKLFQRLMYATSSAHRHRPSLRGRRRGRRNDPRRRPERPVPALTDHAPPRLVRRRRSTPETPGNWDRYFDEHDILITPATPTAAVPDQTSTPAPQRYTPSTARSAPFTTRPEGSTSPALSACPL